MKGRNIYKDLVFLAAFCALVLAAARVGSAYATERKTYGFLIQAPKELTSEAADELRKLSGICRFLPAETAAVTIRIGTYEIETEVMGLDFDEYPIKWDSPPGILKEAQNGHAAKAKESNTWKIPMGNTPLLFFGREIFSSFADPNGYAPLKSQTEKWMNEYQTLDVKVTDESGRERNAKICGILRSPGDKICMAKRQMREVFGESAHTAGGFLEIYGYKNMEKARGLLEAAGFSAWDFEESE